ncbi:hypothetical protein DFH06DRAFT_78811 [Mycena polygramma]|nr:hypothetical protein DFH06DRAFT_78811 [Mycena polygramma]
MYPYFSLPFSFLLSRSRFSLLSSLCRYLFPTLHLAIVFCSLLVSQVTLCAHTVSIGIVLIVLAASFAVFDDLRSRLDSHQDGLR